MKKNGTFTNDAGRVQRIRKALPPPGNAKSACEILCMIGERLDKALFSYGSASEVMDDISLNIPGYGGISYDRIGTVGKVLEHGAGR